MKTPPLRILVIDDDPGVRANIADYLEDSGYAVLKADNGLEGLKIFLSERPDLVLLDLRMPGISGLSFLEQLSKRSSNIPVIVISGAGVLEDAVTALRKGAWEYVTKPISDMRVLEHSIARCLERAELFRERDRYHEQLELEVRRRTSELRASYNELREYQELLQKSNDFLHGLLESTPNPVFHKLPSGGFMGCNNLFLRLILPDGAQDIVGKNFADIFPPDVARVLTLAEDMLTPDHSGKSCEIDLPVPEGRVLRMAVHMGYFYDIAGNPAGVVGTFHDITDLKAKEARILYQATHDELTGLYNRLGLSRHVDALIRDSGGAARFAVTYLDLNDFKLVNDSRGHATGDKLLRAIADRLRSLFPDRCTLCRLGGDDFALICPDSDIQQSLLRTQSIQAAFAKPFVIDDNEIHISASIGMGCYPNDGQDADTLLKNVDLAMYRAKERGGGVQCYTVALTQRLEQRIKLEKLLREGLENEEFRLLYQPKIRLERGAQGAEWGTVVGMEALLRWSTPQGLISPAEFIPVAEETGLIIDLGRWILLQACKQHSELMRQGIGQLRLSVNLSTRQLLPSLPGQVREALAATNLPPHLLELEITESAMMRDLQSTTQILSELKQGGVRIAIDDFGTGHSSLFYLKNFPVDTLKIDKAFVRDIQSDNIDAKLVSAIINMAKGLCLETVAEGVERKDQAEFLARTGCTEIQGYYFSRPLPLEDFANFTRSFNSRKAG